MIDVKITWARSPGQRSTKEENQIWSVGHKNDRHVWVTCKSASAAGGAVMAAAAAAAAATSCTCVWISSQHCTCYVQLRNNIGKLKKPGVVTVFFVFLASLSSTNTCELVMIKKKNGATFCLVFTKVNAFTFFFLIHSWLERSPFKFQHQHFPLRPHVLWTTNFLKIPCFCFTARQVLLATCLSPPALVYLVVCLQSGRWSDVELAQTFSAHFSLTDQKCAELWKAKVFH